MQKAVENKTVYSIPSYKFSVGQCLSFNDGNPFLCYSCQRYYDLPAHSKRNREDYVQDHRLEAGCYVFRKK